MGFINFCHRGKPRHHDDRQFWIIELAVNEQVDAGSRAPWHPNIRNQSIEGRLSQELLSAFSINGGGDLEAGFMKNRDERITNSVVIVDQKQERFFRHSHNQYL